MAGIYLHIPFCKQACSYCDFHFSTTFSKYRDQLIDAMCLEIERRKEALKQNALTSIYFGGGTPSLLTSKELNKILSAIHTHYTIKPDAEITLEANPDDISAEQLTVWSNNGINRLSIGVQSFMEQDLHWMNRAHTAAQAKKSLNLVSNSGLPFSLDLIYGLPNTSDEEWLKNITEALSYHPVHISAYCLTIEPKTQLSYAVAKGHITPCSEDEQAKQFSLLVDTLEKQEYEQYEISNFARDGHYAIHNSAYWKGKPYIGIGPSAHSFNGTNERRWNIANNSKYIQGINEGENYYETEELSPADQFNELLLTGLRTKWGVHLSDLWAIANLPKEFMRTKAKYIEHGDLVAENDHILLSAKGKLIADRIASDLFIVNPE